MKTIIWKELRENFKLAVIGLAIFTFLLVECYRDCSQFFTQLAFGQTYWQDGNQHPFLSRQVGYATTLFCGIFGAVLGWLQIHNERHRDLWAFLLHRPISRSEIFFGKVIAGLCLYTVGAALPLLGYIVIAWMPGHFPVPFAWPMLQPLAAHFLSGIVFYFGGLLTGIRQARWYVSRGLGLGAAIIILMVTARAPEFWRVLVFLVPGTLVIATAAWGSFVSGGYYEGQPVSGRRALVASLTFGCFLVIIFLTSLLMSLLNSPDRDIWTYYSVGKEGAIYKTIRTPGKPTVFTDLKGAPLMDKKTGKPMLQSDFYKIMAPEIYLNPYFETNLLRRNYYQQGFNASANYFVLWRQTVDTLWFWCPNGRLWAYDTMSRRFIGSLGPEGFSVHATTGPGRFSRTEGQNGNGYYYEFYPARTLMTETELYELDYDNRTSKLFFTATNNEHIGAAEDVTKDPNLGAWDYTVAVTKDSVRVLTPDGKIASQVPYEPKYPSYSQIQIHFLDATNKFVFWFDPNYETNELLHWTLPSHVVWAGDQGVIKTLDLPSTERTWHEPLAYRLINVVTSPVSFLIEPFSYWNDFSELALFWKNANFLISIAGAFVFAVVGWGLGRRYYFNAKVQLKWAIFNICFGLPGLLAFICVQEWPARVTCPSCKKLRMVDRENCEHCGAGFPPPPKIGTEIFESVTAK